MVLMNFKEVKKKNETVKFFKYKPESDKQRFSDGSRIKEYRTERGSGIEVCN